MTTWQPQNDFPAIADATKAVTFVAADESTTEISSALRRRITRREVERSGGRFSQADLFWHLPASELSAVPTPGERIVDDTEQSWVILVVDQDVIDGRWRCACRLSSLDTTLVEEVDWLQAAWTKDEHGALDAEWTTAAEGLSAVVQAGEAVQTVVRGVRVLRQTYAVSLSTPLALAVGDRFQLASDALLEVTGFTPPEVMGGVFVAQAVAVNEAS